MPDSGGRGEVFRTLLEQLGCVVLLHGIGCPTDFLQVIAQGESAPRYLIITGHGTLSGLFLGSYATGLGIDVSMLDGEFLPPGAIADRVQLGGTTIIADFCNGATPKMVDAFLSRGAAAYIGSDEEIGVELNVLLLNFFYRLLSLHEPEKLAFEGARAATGAEVESVRYFGGSVEPLGASGHD